MTRRHFYAVLIVALVFTTLALVHVAQIANAAAEGYLQVFVLPTATSVLPLQEDL
jgi:hypothetical protein